jgi:hypothetical protein
MCYAPYTPGSKMGLSVDIGGGNSFVLRDPPLMVALQAWKSCQFYPLNDVYKCYTSHPMV